VVDPHSPGGGGRDLSVKLYPALAGGGTFTSALSAANCRQ